MLLTGETALIGDVGQAQVRSSQEYGSLLNPKHYHKSCGDCPVRCMNDWAK